MRLTEREISRKAERARGACAVGGARAELRTHLAYVEGPHGSGEALERQLAAQLHVGNRFDCAVHIDIDQDLAAKRLVTQSGCEVCDPAGRRILKPPLEADASERRIAVSDADAEAKRVAEVAPFVG